MPIKAIVFDVSGTLLDDIVTVWRANLDAYVALGFDGPKTLEEFRTRFKPPVPEFHKANGIPSELLREVDKNSVSLTHDMLPALRFFQRWKTSSPN